MAAMMLKAPVNSPLPPMPWTALPTMSIFEDEAMPATNDPTINIAWNVMNEYCSKSAQMLSFLLDRIASNLASPWSGRKYISFQ
jgi:hypothetical protein